MSWTLYKKSYKQLYITTYTSSNIINDVCNNHCVYVALIILSLCSKKVLWANQTTAELACLVLWYLKAGTGSCTNTLCKYYIGRRVHWRSLYMVSVGDTMGHWKPTILDSTLPHPISSHLTPAPHLTPPPYLTSLHHPTTPHTTIPPHHQVHRQLPLGFHGGVGGGVGRYPAQYPGGTAVQAAHTHIWGVWWGGVVGWWHVGSIKCSI